MVRIAVVLSGLAVVMVACGISIVAAQQPAATFFRPPEEVGAATPDVGGGRPVGSRGWPATRASTTTTTEGSFRYTATIIGPRVVLTAAHCVDDKATMSIATADGGATVRCDHHDGYDSGRNYLNDIALCLSDRRLTLPSGERHERLNANPAVPRSNALVRLLGYGCTVPGGEVSEFLYTGFATVSGKFDNRIRLSSGAFVCEGDSGGAGYLESDGRRVIVGVNSTRAGNFTYSNLTNVAAPEIASFIATWAEANMVEICGLSAPSAVCRN